MVHVCTSGLLTAVVHPGCPRPEAVVYSREICLHRCHHNMFTQGVYVHTEIEYPVYQGRNAFALA